MDGVLSQEEISALLSDDAGAAGGESNNLLTPDEIDAIGEISNISMGTAATTLFSLVNRKVEISTPVVTIANWDDIIEEYERPCVFIRIAYTTGLDGSNLLVLREQDVKIITDLMMGGDGTNTEVELGELHLSAICEAMNQMMGSSATSLSSMLNKMIDISPPTADLVDLKDTVDGTEIDEFLGGEFVKISFLMEIGDLVKSTIMQLYPPSFAKEMCVGVTETMEADSSTVAAASSQQEPQPAANAATDATDAATDATDAATDATADADDGYANVCTAAGKCTTGTIPGICGRFQSDYATGKYWAYYGCSAGCNSGIRKNQQVHSGYFGICPWYNHRIEQDCRRAD